MSITRFVVAAAMIFAMAGAPHVNAQVLYGTLTGDVSDPASAAVAGDKVEATNQDTNVKTEGTTDEKGIYRFINLRPGPYKVVVTAPSFRVYSQTNVQVQVNEIRRVDVQLQI